MRFFSRAEFSNRFFIGIILLTLSCFAYYFTIADLDEVQAGFNNRRALIVKLLAREITELINKHADLTPRLSSLLSEEAAIYVLVQQPKNLDDDTGGEILAKAENSRISVGNSNEVEAIALTTPYLRFTPFVDPSGTIPMLEAAIPLITHTGKVVLRVGFSRRADEDRSKHVLFRNSLFFSTLFFGLFVYWFIRSRGASSLQGLWLGGAGILVLLLFLSTRFTIQNWYEHHWRNSLVQQGLSTAKLFALSGKRFFSTGDDSELRELQSLLELGETFVYLAIIKDERYVFHSNPSSKGELITNSNYSESLKNSSPMIFNLKDLSPFALGQGELYDIFVPIMENSIRIGTLQLGLRNLSSYGPLSILRNRLILMFLATLFLSLLLVYLLTKQISKDIAVFIRSMEQVTAGDFRQSIFLDREDEFGQMSQTFNFMLMGLRERDMLGKGLQHYVSKSIVDKTLKVLTTQEKTGEKIFAVAIYIYFHGLSEIITQKSAPEIFSTVRGVYQSVQRICKDANVSQLQLHLCGIIAIFTRPYRHDSLLDAIKSAQMINKTLTDDEGLPFSAEVALHGFEVISGAIDEESGNLAFIGEGGMSVHSLARVHPGQEILISEETAYLIREVADLEEIEIRTQEQGHIRAFFFSGFKSSDHLIKIFPESSQWVKVLILKILKLHTYPEIAETLIQWVEGEDEEVKYQILDVLVKIRPKRIIDFITNLVGTETSPRVLSKAIYLLGTIGNENHIPLLAEKLNYRDRRVKANAIEALEAIGGKKVYEYLNLLIDETDNRVRANILIAMGKYGDLKVFELLSRMIKDPDKNMRASAAYALGQLGMVQGVDPLIAALSDKDLNVRRQVVASLTRLKTDLEIEL